SVFKDRFLLLRFLFQLALIYNTKIVSYCQRFLTFIFIVFIFLGKGIPIENTIHFSQLPTNHH
ncbi:MAG: hypothetical protein RR267_06200, partial [Erysipelotrichaceae bacterium]